MKFTIVATIFASANAGLANLRGRQSAFVLPGGVSGPSSHRDGPATLLEALKALEKPVVVGLAADSGCGKTTFMRRIASILEGELKPNPLINNPKTNDETNTQVSDLLTTICLDDYHKLDRKGRAETGLSALHPDANDFVTMEKQVKMVKTEAPKTFDKVIYNHVTGEIDAAEPVELTDLMIFEGLHPMFAEGVRQTLDYAIYLDVVDDVKFAWKIQRDHEERGHSIESIKKSIEGRKPDFSAYIEPQKSKADVVCQILPSDVFPGNANKGRDLRVRLITITPNKAKGHPDPFTIPDMEIFNADKSEGFVVKSYKESWMGKDADVIDIDGGSTDINMLLQIVDKLGNISEKARARVKEGLTKFADAPGSTNASGLLQTLLGAMIVKVYDNTHGKADAAIL
uniref:Phosphoribulokinase n=2 Tax=Chromera velia TaxID=505693 RepID=X2D8N5_9ALVE|nr:chloroplast phosphoribulokinase [Chromera velia]|mmetsp:Transcript_24859/g.48695  ORF Transcript_24859/g.48695 Transcript_24859/m.48695 type:complete len:400 (+) Transcript_24859:91-1290(+)|eukprot:Cvel_14585.t1-p1 / transcript=Cvel_14585.t1 / gene=Cvel_14585 / organism=Chromera_velia_CCMP2878 / gene_product=Phosphoribulokinase, chloroplastic, putative / transcript_product=Phosphoribulokinase, chloroplastic, putative / location=Cvel_scaffold1043:6128-10612(+) / protein_length=399 / sequence_SO=supercontig / SO=protein_coding / is_pseudo=false